MALVGAKRGVVAVVAVVALVSAAWAEKTHSKTDFWLKPNLTAPIDWGSKSSYQKSASNPSEYDYAPEEGDVIVLSAGLKASIAADDKDIDLVRNMAAFILYADAELEIVADNDLEWNSAIRAYNESACTAKVTKRGTGNLQLMSRSYVKDYTATVEWQDYLVSWDVQAGTLTLVNCLEKKRNRWVYSLNVAEGAVLDVGTGTGTGSKGEMLGGMVVIYGALTGKGTVCKADDGRLNVLEFRGNSILGHYSRFDGRITGCLSMRLYGYELDLTGVNNDFNGGEVTFYDDSDGDHSCLGFVYQGGSSGLSSAGYQGFSITRPATLKHIGYADGAYTYGSKGCYFIGWNLIVDGGAYGNFDCNNTFGMQSSYIQNTAMTFTGSNQVECVYRGQFNEKIDSAGHKLSARFIKEGTGTWRFGNNNNRLNGGVIEVNEGTLRFDSIAEVGTVCSLGRADALFESYEGAYDETKLVEHAFELGSTKATEAIATMEYTGTSDATVTTRKFALKGEGRLTMAETAGKLDLTGFGLLKGQTAATLHLGADNFGKANFARDFDAGEGAIDIVKEGAGEWTMSGKLAGIRSLKVKEGTLNYQNHTRYEYYRWIIKEASGESFAETREVGLFDKDGYRQNLYLNYNNGYKIEELKRGEFMMVNYAGTRALNYDRAPMSMFDDQTTNLFNNAGNSCGNSVQIKSGNDSKYSVDNDATWGCVVMRLDVLKCNPVTAVDFVASWGAKITEGQWAGGYKYAPTVWSLEGSVDGRHWTEVCNSADCGFAKPANGGYWYKSNTSHTAGSTAPGKTKTDNYAIAAYAGEVVTSSGLALQVDSAGALSLGDAITISKLTVDTGMGIGMIDGVSLAPTGVLALENVEGFFEEVYLWDINVNANPVFADLVNWSVSINGQPTARAVEFDEDGYARIRPLGTIIYLR